MKRIFWLMLAVVVVATGVLLSLRQYLYVEPVADIVVTPGDEEIVLTGEIYVAEDGTRAILETDVRNDRVLLTFGEYDRAELVSAASASGAKYENAETGLEVWEKAGNIVIYEGDIKLFESVETLTSMVEADLIAYLIENSPWTWSETVDASGSVTEPIRTDAFTLTFASDGEVSGTTDCNDFSGTYKAKGGVLSFGSFISTLKGCEETQETEFTGALAQVAGAAITKEGDLRLELGGSDGTVTLLKR